MPSSWPLVRLVLTHQPVYLAGNELLTEIERLAASTLALATVSSSSWTVRFRFVAPTPVQYVTYMDIDWESADYSKPVEYFPWQAVLPPEMGNAGLGIQGIL